ncbi:DUF2804 domain-containing protein [Treponema sp. OMZ 840]|uniref:DUF2804 domain-containing protein n=1 Tax=Treponema sp. OMZ 840 TaxID=244313 RepID=UPI003D8EA219
MNHEVIKDINLLDNNGHIIEEGWARRPVWKYERSKVKASALKIKEWDYYSITHTKELWSLNATVADLGFGALFSVSFIDFKLKSFAQKDEMKFFTFGKTGLSACSTEDNKVSFSGKGLSLSFSKTGNTRRLHICVPNLSLPGGNTGIEADLELYQAPGLESMNIATSWKEKRTCFYLNEKVNCMSVSGSLKLGNDDIRLGKDEVWAVLDWGRGNWTRKNRWYWASGSGSVKGKSFGFNLGYGFTDRTPASENVIFYDGKIHKLENVFFHIPENDYLKPWTFSSSDKRFEMRFIPAVDRFAATNLGIIQSIQHQVFGFFTGTAVLDDGKTIRIEHFPAFAEDVYNKW